MLFSQHSNVLPIDMSSTFASLLAVFLLVPGLYAAPTAVAPGNKNATELNNPDFRPIPGESPYYTSYNGTAVPFPGNYTTAIPPTKSGAPGADDLLFQNLLGAEWAIFFFYQFGVDTFNTADFVKAGFPVDTYARIVEIRDNEAGHARIFQEAISETSYKPAPCKYNYGIKDVVGYLAAHTIVEISSMAFLTGLILQAKLDSSKQALLAIAQVEARHTAWGLMDVWKTSPFGGPVDTAFPYANEILDTTRVFVVPGSCPPGNPTYPSPSQNLPTMSYVTNSSTLAPGSPYTLAFPNPKNQPKFTAGKEYYIVYFHGLRNITVPYDPKTKASKVPMFEQRGVILALLTDAPGAPTLESVHAGPLIIIEQPLYLNKGV